MSTLSHQTNRCDRAHDASPQGGGSTEPEVYDLCEDQWPDWAFILAAMLVWLVTLALAFLAGRSNLQEDPFPCEDHQVYTSHLRCEDPELTPTYQ